MLLLTQAVEVEAHVEEQIEEQLKDGTLETALQAVVDLLRTAPKTVVEFRSSARRRGSRSNRKNKKKRLETVDDWQNTIAISRDGFGAENFRNRQF